MTTIEYQNYLIDHGIEFKEAQAIATGLEKRLSINEPVTKDFLEAKLSRSEMRLYAVIVGAAYPVWQQVLNLPKFW